jgi:putative CocE/NonD family hydrolase
VTAHTAPIPSTAPRNWRRRAVDATLRRMLKLPGGDSDYTIARDLRIPTRDGVELLADHYAPAGEAAGTVLLRSPYGFNALTAALFAGPYAASGYHVVLARCRGTFGSGGAFEPMVHEIDDAADTVAWLRRQPWFGGRFATAGPSYLGFTQWALLMDPPPELAAVVIQVAPHDFSRSVYAGGAFNLNDFLGWTEMVAHQEEVGVLRNLVRRWTETRRLAPALSTLPVVDAADGLCGERAPWYRGWTAHRDLTHPFWTNMQLGAALDRVQVPVLLQTGWQDLFLQQTLAQYAHLHGRGVEVALTIGPWTHIDVVGKAAPGLFRESLDWFAEHLAGTGSRMRWTPVRLFVTGAQQWRDLPEWPPASTARALHLQPGGALGAEPAPAGSAPVGFTYDPADPTPTLGGRLLAPTGGYRDDTRLAGRSDVLAFTAPPLAAALEVVGNPVVELAHSSDNPHADLFVRVSEVDAAGRSRNVSDGFQRLDPARVEGTVRIELDAVAHRFAAGHRIRLLVAGGSFPRWERNLGTGADPATSSGLRPSRWTIDVAGSRVLLPVRA